jgi:hypothetical protein
MEEIRSSETSVHTRSTRRHIPENGIRQSHRRENLKSYIGNTHQYSRIFKKVTEVLVLLSHHTSFMMLLRKQLIKGDQMPMFWLKKILNNHISSAERTANFRSLFVFADNDGKYSELSSHVTTLWLTLQHVNLRLSNFCSLGENDCPELLWM